MWTAVLVLAIAVNFEPIRIGLITLTLSRPRPTLQLLTFLCGSCTMSIGAGLLILFVIPHGPLSAARLDNGKPQIVIGLLAVLIAAVLATNVSAGRFTRRPRTGAEAGDRGLGALPAAPPQTPGHLSALARRLLQGSSPWFSGAAGVSVALPSIDYVALLLLITTSGAAPVVQTGALLTFVAVANAVVLVPVVSSLVTPDKTHAFLEKLRDWIRTRRRRDVAAVLAMAGCLMTAAGICGL